MDGFGITATAIAEVTEVHLSEGSQDYDLVGYSKEQIINDILDQYERHMQYLHLVR